MTTNAANHDTGRIAPDLTAAGNGQASPQVAPKGLQLIAGFAVPDRCPGPAGTWPCALPFGHGGDHARFVAAEPVPSRDLGAENAELRSCLLVALPLLRDCEQRRGGFARLGLVARIERAVR